MKHKIYIAGKVTGEDKLECACKFKKAKQELEALGFEAINPLEVVGTWDIRWEAAMKLCIIALLKCDIVYAMPCVQDSKGAKIELELARRLGIPTYDNLDNLK